MSDNIPRYRDGDAGHDDVMGTLTLLGAHEPDPVREVRLRGRCHAALRKRQPRPPSHAPVVAAGWRRRIEPAIVGILCAVYLIEVLGRAIRLYPF